MTNTTTPSPMTLVPSLEAAWRDVDSSFERPWSQKGILAGGGWGLPVATVRRSRRLSTMPASDNLGLVKLRIRVELGGETVDCRASIISALEPGDMKDAIAFVHGGQVGASDQNVPFFSHDLRFHFAKRVGDHTKDVALGNRIADGLECAQEATHSGA